MSETLRYQTHPGHAPGMSDSATKLSLLRLPADLTGQRVLDIGCNEGYFSAVAARLGAAEVIGLDVLAENIQFARATYGELNIDFRLGNWRTLPDGPFDLVLWTSSMHYERDPRRVLDRIHEILAPDGTLVLECGVAPGGRREMVFYQRPRDHHWYPTARYLLDVLLPDFAVRQVSWNNVVKGDPVPRSVFHCTRRRPVVALVTGPSRSGKSSLSALLEPAATSVIRLDEFVLRVASGAAHVTPLQKLIQERFEHDRRDELYRAIDEEGLSDELAAALAGSVTSADRFVVIEGAFTGAQAELLRRRLDAVAEVWEVSLAGAPRLPPAAQPADGLTTRQSGEPVRHTEAHPSSTGAGVAKASVVRRVVRSVRRRLQLLLALAVPQSVLPVVWRNPLFDGDWYLERNSDVAAARADPERHYRRHGAREGRDPCPLFHTRWYEMTYPAAARSRLNPLDHYLLVGAAAGFDPSPLFRTSTYLELNPDVARSGINPLLHYIRHGATEGRERPALSH